MFPKSPVFEVLSTDRYPEYDVSLQNSCPVAMFLNARYRTLRCHVIGWVASEFESLSA